MKHLKKLGSRGHTHLIVPIIVIAIIGAIGTYLLTRSHADTLTSYANGTVYTGGAGGALTSTGVLGSNFPAVVSPALVEHGFGYSWTGKQYAFSSFGAAYSSLTTTNGQSGMNMSDGHGGSFSVDSNTGNQIIVGDTNDAMAKEYTDTGYQYLNLLAWSRSPDTTGAGQKVVFQEKDPNTGSQIGSLDIDTGTFITYKLASNSITVNGSSVLEPNNGLAQGTLVGIDWSQDNSQINYAYTSFSYVNGGAAAEMLNICRYTISSQSASCQQVNGFSNSTSAYNIASLVWSPDGSRIAYIYNGNVFMADANGNNPTQLASSARTDTPALAWMPDGQSLLYTVGSDNQPIINKITLATKAISLFSNLTASSNTDSNQYGGSVSASLLAVQPLPTSAVSSDATVPTFSNTNASYDYSRLRLNVTATDNIGVSHVDAYNGTQLLQAEAGLVSGGQIIIVGLPSAPANITLKAYDFNGNVATTTVPVAVPTISGTLKVGYTLTANPGSWTGGTSYQWYMGGSPISGATAKTFKLTSAQLNKGVAVSVTYSQSGYANSVSQSDYTNMVAAGTLTAPTPKISGTLKVGYALTANPGTWTTGTTLRYQWYASGKAVSGATAKTFKLATAQHGKTMVVHVIGSQAGYTTLTKSSAATAAVQ